MKKSILTFFLAFCFFYSCQVIDISDEELKAPGSLTAVANGTSVTLEWPVTSGSTSYMVYYKKDSSGVSVSDYTGSKENINLNTTNIDNLDSGYTYAFIVVAIGTGGTKSAPSPVATAALTATVPVPELSVATGIVIGDQSVTFTNQPSTIPMGMEISYTVDGNPPDNTSDVLINSSINISQSCTLRVKYYVPGWAPSTSKETSVDLDLVDIYSLWQDGSGGYLLKNNSINPLYTFSTGTPIPTKFTYSGNQWFFAASSGNGIYVLKNGNILNSWLSGTNITIAGIVDVGGTLYIAGTNNNMACYWTCSSTDGSGLGAPTALAAANSSANTICMNGSNVYIGGNKRNSNNKSQACYWIRGASSSEVTLTPDTEASLDYAVYSILSDGTSVIASGTVDNGMAMLQACFWQSGDTSTYILVGAGVMSEGKKVLWDGAGNAYVCGYESSNQNAVVWKLGLPYTGSNKTTISVNASFTTMSAAMESTSKAIFCAGKTGANGCAVYYGISPYANFAAFDITGSYWQPHEMIVAAR